MAFNLRQGLVVHTMPCFFYVGVLRLLSAATDNSGEDSAGIDANAACREVAQRLTTGAATAEANVDLWNSALHGRDAISLGQIDVGFAGNGIAPYDSIEVETRIGELLYHFITHFEAVLADGGTDGNHNALRVSSETAHGLYGAGNDAVFGSFPTGMGCSDNATRGVGEYQGHAIGSIDAYHYVGEIGNQSIYVVEAYISVRTSCYLSHIHRVSLARHYQPSIIDIQVATKQSATSHYMLVTVAGVVANIKFRIIVIGASIATESSKSRDALKR